MAIRAAAKARELAQAQMLTKNRDRAYKSWSRIQAEVSEVLMVWKEQAHTWPEGERMRRDAELRVLVHLEESAARVLSHADEEWYQWREARALESTARATWIAALAAGAAALGTVWQIVRAL